MADDEGLQASKRLWEPGRRRLKRVFLRLGNLSLGIGFLLSFLGVSYYAYSLRAQAELPSLNQRLKEPSAEPTDAGDRAYVLALERAWTPPESLTEVRNLDNALDTEMELASGLEGNTALAPLTSLEALSPDSPFVAPVLSGLSPGQLPPATRIVITAIGVDSPVVHLGIRYKDGSPIWETANKAVGHHLGSSNPGEAGNIVMSGHISSPTEGSVFKRLPGIRLGDEITLYTSRGEYQYRVVETKVVLPTEVKVMDQTIDPVLTLITCVPDWVYTHRLIVTAKPKVSLPSSIVG